MSMRTDGRWATRRNGRGQESRVQYECYCVHTYTAQYECSECDGARPAGGTPLAGSRPLSLHPARRWVGGRERPCFCRCLDFCPSPLGLRQAALRSLAVEEKRLVESRPPPGRTVLASPRPDLTRVMPPRRPRPWTPQSPIGPPHPRVAVGAGPRGPKTFVCPSVSAEPTAPGGGRNRRTRRETVSTVSNRSSLCREHPCKALCDFCFSSSFAADCRKASQGPFGLIFCSAAAPSDVAILS